MSRMQVSGLYSIFKLGAFGASGPRARGKRRSGSNLP